MTPLITPSDVLASGLKRGLKEAFETEVHSFYADALAGYTELGGPFVRGELGGHLAQDLTAFVQGGFERETGWGTGIGLRWVFP